MFTKLFSFIFCLKILMCLQSAFKGLDVEVIGTDKTLVSKEAEVRIT